MAMRARRSGTKAWRSPPSDTARRLTMRFPAPPRQTCRNIEGIHVRLTCAHMVALILAAGNLEHIFVWAMKSCPFQYTYLRFRKMLPPAAPWQTGKVSGRMGFGDLIELKAGFAARRVVSCIPGRRGERSGLGRRSARTITKGGAGDTRFRTVWGIGDRGTIVSDRSTPTRGGRPPLFRSEVQVGNHFLDGPLRHGDKFRIAVGVVRDD